MSEATILLEAAAGGDRRAAGELLPLVYDELRKLAAARMAVEPSGHSLDPTALVHEAYLRLVGPEDGPQWENRGMVAAEVAKLRADAEQRARNAEVQRAKTEVQSAEQRKRRRVQLALAGCAFSLLAMLAGGLWWRETVASERETERQVEAARN